MYARKNGKVLTFKPVITAQAYAANKQLGGVNTITMMQEDEGAAMLNSLVVADADNQKSVMDIWLFADKPSMVGVDTSDFELTKANLQKALGVVHIAAADYVSSKANMAIATKSLLYLLLQAKVINSDFSGNIRSQKGNNLGAGNIYAVINCGGTPTYTATDSLQVSLGVTIY